jgi:hypothetical protein
MMNHWSVAVPPFSGRTQKGTGESSEVQATMIGPIRRSASDGDMEHAFGGEHGERWRSTVGSDRLDVDPHTGPVWGYCTLSIFLPFSLFFFNLILFSIIQLSFWEFESFSFMYKYIRTHILSDTYGLVLFSCDLILLGTPFGPSLPPTRTPRVRNLGPLTAGMSLFILIDGHNFLPGRCVRPS